MDRQTNTTKESTWKDGQVDRQIDKWIDIQTAKEHKDRFIDRKHTKHEA